MLYFRRIWGKLILLMLAVILIAKLILAPLSKLIMWLINRSIVSMTISSKLTEVSMKLGDYSIDLIHLALALLFFIGFTLMIWLLIDVFTGQLKLDYYSVQLGKHLQRSQINNLQMIESEQNKANYWLKRLRIIHWKHRLYVLIPCGPNAAVESVIKERCDGYVVGWLNLTVKNSNWINKINECNKLHFNWLILKTK